MKATEALFEEFLTTCSSSESGAAALDSIAEFEQMVCLSYFTYSSDLVFTLKFTPTEKFKIVNKGEF